MRKYLFALLAVALVAGGVGAFEISTARAASEKGCSGSLC
jgi:hypothetical protein